MITNEIKKRFWSKTRKRRNGCIDWIAAKSSSGYGFKFDHKDVGAHRMAWLLTHGEIPIGKIPHDNCILHKCDNKSCVNPDHLILGSQKENMLDKVSKDRQLKGQKHGNSKLTEFDVKCIRLLYSTGEYLMRELGFTYGVDKSMVNLIVKRKNWSHI
jgi:hypothetical protein